MINRLRPAAPLFQADTIAVIRPFARTAGGLNNILYRGGHETQNIYINVFIWQII